MLDPRHFREMSCPSRQTTILYVHICGALFGVAFGFANLAEARADDSKRFTQQMDTVGFQAMEFTPDGANLVRSHNGHLYFWDVKSWKETKISHAHRFPDKTVTAFIVSMSFNPDGSVLCTAGDNNIRQWSMPKREVQFKYDYRPCGVRFSPDGKLLALSVYENLNRNLVGVKGERLRPAIIFVDPATGKEVSAITKLNSPVPPPPPVLRFPDFAEVPLGVSMLSFSPDGKYLFTAVSAVMQVWDVAKGERVALLDTSDPDGRGKGGFGSEEFYWSPDGSEVCAVGSHDDGTKPSFGDFPTYLIRWDARTGKQTLRKALPQIVAPAHSVLSPDGKRFYVYARQVIPKERRIPSRVFGVDAATGEIVWEGPNFKEASATKAILVSPDGKLLVTSSERAFTVWDLPAALQQKFELPPAD